VYDIGCAEHFGARSLAADKGRFYTTNDLIECKPDALLPDLSDIDLMIKTLASL
jgi:hypothetical protein